MARFWYNKAMRVGRCWSIACCLWVLSSVALAQPTAKSEFSAKALDHWAFNPPRAPSLPQVQNHRWPTQALDRFILARLEHADLQPAAKATKAKLLRRVSLGLTGLPPAPHETAAFLNDKSPQAYERVVDRLLASHQYGEQWARHWLDLVRYADTLGGTANFPFANAYRYRDYVIRAFNRDKPFDRFIHELIAGDLLPAGNAAAEADRFTGPGALLLGPRILEKEIVAAGGQVEMLTRVLLGMNLGCSRCHDHPFEPLPTEDFYALTGVFASTQSKRFERTILLPGSGKMRVLSVQEGKIKNLRIHHQGDSANLGRAVPRGFPAILQAAGSKARAVGKQVSGRLQLAKWLTEPRHPLTARVIVNRVWQRHFGVGLVADPDNFGMSAVSGPSHPKLLDWLALWFIDNQWSIKKLNRMLVLSATYQQSSAISANPDAGRAIAKDPTNVLLWSQRRRRMEAEEIRDSLLFISGNLDHTMGGSLLAQLGLGNGAELKKAGRLERVVASYGRGRQRSIYRPVIRSEMHMAEILDAFDFPSRDESTGRRSASTNAIQSLLLMNNSFIIEQAKATAQRTAIVSAPDDEKRIQRLYRVVLSRSATPFDVGLARRYLSKWRKRSVSAAKADKTSGQRDPWNVLCHALFMFNEFIYVD